MLSVVYGSVLRGWLSVVGGIVMAGSIWMSLIVVLHQVYILFAGLKVLGSCSGLVFNGLIIAPFIMFLSIPFPPNLQLESVPEPLGVHKAFNYPLFLAMYDDRWGCIRDLARDCVYLCF
jgi:hypothetical protein